MEVKHNVDQMKFWTEVDGYEAHVAYQLHDKGLDIRPSKLRKECNLLEMSVG